MRKAVCGSLQSLHARSLKDNGILGKVDHHMIRWEAQHRGSLHAHILQWVDAADTDRVAHDIMAYVPAEYDEQQCSWTVPDPITQLHEHALYNIVMRKQMHSCTEWSGKAKGWRDEKGRCKMHFNAFPFQANSIVQHYIQCCYATL